MKRFISIMLVCFMFATLLPVAVFADDAIEIDTPEEFAAIADNLGGSYKLTADITITQGLSYGNEGALFTGTFDGNGHTITVNFENTNQRTGVFCSVGACTIKNLTVEGTITSVGNSCGGVVGTAKGNITFENVTSKVTMVGTGDSEGSSGHGGILGVNEGCTVSFYNCTSSANITGRRCAGGFIGLIRNRGSVEYFENCVFDGTVRCDSEWSDKRGAGGYIGVMHHDTGDEVNVTFKNCQSNGTVTSDYILASAWVASYARWANANNLPAYDNCTQTAKVYTCGYEVSLVTDTRYVEAMDSQSSGKVSFNKEEGTVTVTNADMAMNADTVAAKVNAGVKVYVGGVLDESAVVTSDGRRISVVSNDPTVTEGELISVILVFSDGSYTTLGQSKEVFNDNTRLVDFTLVGANVSSTDTSVNMNYVAPVIPDEPFEYELTTDKTEYTVGDAITVTATGEGKDWVGIYNPGEPHSIYWAYIDATNGGVGSGVAFDIVADGVPQDDTVPATLPAGNYIIRLMPNDSTNIDDAIKTIEIVIAEAQQGGEGGEEGGEEGKPATGDMTLVLLIISTIAMIGTALVVNKRRQQN